MSAIYFKGQSIITIFGQQLAELKQLAVQAPLRRARFCLHQQENDGVHEMVIAFCKDSYVRPHRHSNKSESFHVIEGELMVVFFDDDGKITRKLTLGDRNSAHPFLYRLADDQWHMVIPLTEYVVIHETTKGPFIKAESAFAPWSPQDGDSKAIDALLKRVLAE